VRQRDFLSGTWLLLNNLAVSFLLVWAGIAYASDCPPNDPSRLDCQGAASTARSPLVPLAGAIAGVLVNGRLISRTRLQPPSRNGDGDKGDDDEEPTEYTLDIRTQDQRTTLLPDDEDSLWIYGQVRCNKPEVDTASLTSSLTFGKEGPNAEWLKMDEPKMYSGFKAVCVHARPPYDEAQLINGDPMVRVSTTIDGNEISGPVTLTIEEEYELEIF
jgi:hypothetical protein